MNFCLISYRTNNFVLYENMMRSFYDNSTNFVCLIPELFVKNIISSTFHSKKITFIVLDFPPSNLLNQIQLGKNSEQTRRLLVLPGQKPKIILLYFKFYDFHNKKFFFVGYENFEHNSSFLLLLL